MATTAMGDGDLVDLLAKYKPVRVDAVMGDDTKQRIAVPSKGQKWARLASILAALPWVELHCLNGRGELVAPPIARGPAAELEPLGAPDVAGGGVGLLQVNAVAQMFSSVVRETMRTAVDGLTKMRDSGRGEMKDILDAHKDLATDFAQQLATETRRRMDAEELVDDLRAQLAELHGELVKLRSAGDTERGGMLERILEAQAGKMLGLTDGTEAPAAAPAAKGGAKPS